MQVLKVEVHDVGFKPLASREVLGFKFSPDVGLHARGDFMVRLCLSLFYPLHCGLLLICIMCSYHSVVFRVFLSSIVPYVAKTQCVRRRRYVQVLPWIAS